MPPDLASKREGSLFAIAWAQHLSPHVLYYLYWVNRLLYLSQMASHPLNHAPSYLVCLCLCVTQGTVASYVVPYCRSSPLPDPIRAQRHIEVDFIMAVTMSILL